jgi:hypothetical protein
MNKNSHRPKGVAIAVLGMSADGYLMVGFNQVNFRKNGATSHAVIERQHVGLGVPVRYREGVQVTVVAAGAPRPVLLGNQVQRGCPRRVGAANNT